MVVWIFVLKGYCHFFKKYYDAINLAYLYNITDSIETEYANEKEEITEIYQKLSKIWRIDDNSWWEISSDAEFLMLLGQYKLPHSISNISLLCVSINHSGFNI